MCQWSRFKIDPQALHTRFYNGHTHRTRLEKLLYIELSRSSNGYFKPLLDPGGPFGFRSKAVINLWRLCVTAIPQRTKCPFGCSGHVTAVAVVQRQRFILVSECLPGFISVL
jgi:hypothetical protein